MEKLRQGHQIDLEMLEEAKDGLKLGFLGAGTSARLDDHMSIQRKLLLNKIGVGNSSKKSLLGLSFFGGFGAKR